MEETQGDVVANAGIRCEGRKCASAEGKGGAQQLCHEPHGATGHEDPKHPR